MFSLCGETMRDCHVNMMAQVKKQAGQLNLAAFFVRPHMQDESIGLSRHSV
jgi:hypothetical protein